jgi:HEPN domain-containing protein
MQIGKVMNVAEAFMCESLSDLDTAKMLYNKGKYSHAIYHMQQSFEKSIKSLYCHSRIKYDKNSEQDVYNQARKYGYNTKKSTLDLLVKISNIEEKFLLSSLPPERLKDPRYQHLTTQLKQATNGFREKVKRLENKKEPSVKTILKTFPKFIGENYQKYESNILLIKKLVPEVISSNNVSIPDLSPLSYSFLLFVNSACLLYPCLSKMEAVTRYPDYNFQNMNISIFNENNIKNACDKIIKMLDIFVEIASKTRK